MATNIPPHNLAEILAGCLALIDNPQTSIEELMSFIPGPDFPTAGIINGVRELMKRIKQDVDVFICVLGRTLKQMKSQVSKHYYY